MKNRRTIHTFIIIAAVLIFCAIPVMAGGGGGGLMSGYLYPSLFPALSSTVTANSIYYFGGFGYGILNDRTIIGGFGFALQSDPASAISGGVGGILSGYLIIDTNFVNVYLMNHLGLGGVSTDTASYFVLFEELDLEVGICIVPWMQISAYVGFQVMGNLLPGRAFSDFLSYSPVVGVSISWGYFKS